MNKLQSMEDLLNRKSLFVRDIDPSIPKFDVKSDLTPVCPKDVGLVCVPVDPNTQATLGYAYLNFKTSPDAKEALRAYRFQLKVGGKPVGINYSVSNKDRQKIMGPWGYRLSIIVKNLSSEATERMLFNKFEAYGEVFRCRVGTADYGATYGLVQYIEERSVIRAVKEAHKAAWLSSVIEVERHEKAGMVYQSRLPPTMPRAEPRPQLSPREYTRQGSPAPSYASLVSQGSQACQETNVRSSADVTPTAMSDKHSPFYDSNGSSSMRPSRSEDAKNNKTSAYFDSNGSNSMRIPHQDADEDRTSAYFDDGSISMTGLQQEDGSSHYSYGRRHDSLGPYVPSPQTPIVSPQPSPRNVDRSPSTPRPAQSVPNGVERQPFVDSDTVDEAIPNGVGVMSFMAGRRNRMYEVESSRRAPAPQRTPTPLAQAPAVPDRKTGEHGQMTLSSVLQYLSDNAENVVRSMMLWEKLTGGQMDQGFLCCPITQEMFRDPVLASDGNTYERSAITEWLFTKNSNTSPLTGAPLPSKELVPNHLVAKIVEELR